ncbi:glutamate racemase [Levilactobacillus spicheri]|uniref:Glutamate racemase n=2 Tax=Levilactobacillus spicheri TaxID=216463 RepID=A0ABQ0WN20_9LACO|nr:glutamate racemase [Levilactobacillus spicheri]KRL46582.1 glutamate racemase [Levilactobacillus spicheri DSM 15429]GEO65955.1 hypothetical protein LSP04_03740 [Levilactobacillus spicheri]
MQNHPIGLMDSGVGGLTVLREIQRLLPTEETVYLGDQGRLPYGPRSPQEVAQFTQQIEAFLERRHQIKLFVIACNTATAAALPALRQRVKIPVVGVIVPGARSAVQATRRHRIGVIATQGTVKSDQYRHQIQALAPGDTVVSLATPDFVKLVEHNDLTSPQAFAAVARGLAPFKHQDIDTLVMGCTHFPLLRAAIQAALGPDVTLVDPGTATAEMVTALLDYAGQANDTGVLHPATVTYTTGDPAQFDTLAQAWLTAPVLPAQPVSLATLEQATLEESSSWKKS